MYSSGVFSKRPHTQLISFYPLLFAIPTNTKKPSTDCNDPGKDSQIRQIIIKITSHHNFKNFIQF